MEHFGQCEVTDNGKTALAMFHHAHQQGQPFDLVMLDIDMPQMDGMQVLSEMIQTQIKLKVPDSRKAKILIVSSNTNKDRVLSCIQSGCDDFIAKPFDIDTIGKKLSKLGIRVRENELEHGAVKSKDDNSSSHFIDGIVSAFEGKKINLPTLPRIQPKFRELLMTGAVSQRIADLLKKDVAISAELIRMSNSAYYKGLIPNKSLEQAISRIGAAATEQVVTELTGRQFFTIKNKKFRTLIEKVWKHSIACAYASEITAKKFNGGISQAKLVETITAHHEVVGAKLLEKWKYADSYIACASDHKNGGDDEEEETKELVSKELLIVRFANLAAKSMGYSMEESEYTNLPLENIELAYDLKLNLIDINKLKEKLTEEMKAVMELF
jgi:HD-like signal output (HDOD) protein